MSNEIWHSAGFWEELHVVGWSYEMFTNFGGGFVFFFWCNILITMKEAKKAIGKTLGDGSLLNIHKQ